MFVKLFGWNWMDKWMFILFPKKVPAPIRPPVVYSDVRARVYLWDVEEAPKQCGFRPPWFKGR